MKGRITPQVKLIISAENDTEAFGLQVWLDNYKHGSKQSSLGFEQLIVKAGEQVAIDINTKGIKDGK